ncbi:MAG: hypothetical protein ABI792_01505 [bacterium]
MRENIKRDYLKYLFHKTLTDLSRFNISNQDSEFINKLFDKLCYSEDVLIELYMLNNIKNLRNIGNYLIFIYKKMEDNVINFDNLSQNLNTDAEFIQNEILNYLSNPKLIGKEETDPDEDKIETREKTLYRENVISKEETMLSSELNKENTEDDAEDEDILKFKKNYLELIQSEESDEEIVFDLPVIQNNDTGEKIIIDIPSIEKMATEGQATEIPVSKVSENSGEIKKESELDIPGEDDNAAELYMKEVVPDPVEPENTVRSKDYKASEEENNEEENNEEENNNKEKYNEADEEGKEPVSAIKLSVIEHEKIPLSEDILEELNLFNESEDSADAEDDSEEEISNGLPPTNESFTEYENEIRDKNITLNNGFDKMINFVNVKNIDEGERTQIINNIIDTSTYLESLSRKMSLEIISNIYQTITFSFEKIADGKYDLSESTLNLFKSGLILVISLIKGDDYFGYKDILKSIENIRNSLIEEKEKREKYLKRLQEKFDLEKNLRRQYPEDSQKENLKQLKKLIKDTESKFNMLEKITGEYQIYEALRSLSGNLNNFKEIVKLSKELQQNKLVQLSEASYIFTKFLQNYRINPVTTETKEIFGYIIYNLKSLAIGKPVEDINLFISYLNDPVKIFSKTETKK